MKIWHLPLVLKIYFSRNLLSKKENTRIHQKRKPGLPFRTIQGFVLQTIENLPVGKATNSVRLLAVVQVQWAPSALLLCPLRVAETIARVPPLAANGFRDSGRRKKTSYSSTLLPRTIINCVGPKLLRTSLIEQESNAASAIWIILGPISNILDGLLLKMLRFFACTRYTVPNGRKSWKLYLEGQTTGSRIDFTIFENALRNVWGRFHIRKRWRNWLSRCENAPPFKTFLRIRSLPERLQRDSWTNPWVYQPWVCQQNYDVATPEMESTSLVPSIRLRRVWGVLDAVSLYHPKRPELRSAVRLVGAKLAPTHHWRSLATCFVWFIW